VAADPGLATSNNRLTRAILYAALLLFAVFFLLPLFVMLVNSVKPLDEIRGGNMLALPEAFTTAPWASAWSSAQIGVEPTGLSPFFWNSLKMVVPAVIISTLMGALNGYVLTKWRFRGDNLLFGLMLFACFIPFQIVLIPILGMLGLAGTTAGLVMVHVVYGLGFTTLFFRNYYAAFPSELVKAAKIDGAGFFRIFQRILLPSSGPIIVVTVIAVHQCLERFPVRSLLCRLRQHADDGRPQQFGQLVDRREGIQCPLRRRPTRSPTHPHRLHRLRPLLRPRPRQRIACSYGLT